jgi:DUF1365 family protein
MGMNASVLNARVMHKRMFPRENRFVYGIYYIALPLSGLDQLDLNIDRTGILSFYRKDHGAKDGSDLEGWARKLLGAYGLDKADGEIVLICMPRVFGYVFNPVSFWLCYDSHKELRAVICEVNNTFGETHRYICAHPDQSVISSDDILSGEKLFHVSPFLEREGSYQFRFALTEDQFAVFIDFFNADNKKQLVTSLAGKLVPLTSKNLSRAFWRYPLVTFKAIGLIHYQAIKLIMKGIRHIRKPEQFAEHDSATQNLTKN